MKNFTEKLLNFTKIFFLVVGFGLIGNTIFAQKVIIIGANYSNNTTRNDGVAFVVNTPLVSGDVIYITDFEYNATTNVFGNASTGVSVESIMKFTANTSIAKGQVITCRFASPMTVGDPVPITVACTGGTCGTATFTNLMGGIGYRTAGESLYAYSDSDDDPTNGVTEIFSVFYPGDETANNGGGNIPANESPVPDFPNAVVVDGFNWTGVAELNLIEFTPATRSANVSKATIENPSNYTQTSNPALNPSTTVFASLNLSGTNPVLTLATSTTSIIENASGTITFTFTLSANAASNITVNFNVTGTATFGTDYTQSGAASFTTTAGTITIPSGSNTASFTIDPTGDGILEPDETVIITTVAGTGYDAGNPSARTVTITNDDTGTSLPKVALVGINHADISTNPTHQDGFSFVALDDLTSGTVVYFTRRIYDKNALAFTSTYTSTVKWTAGSGVNRGDVYTVMETATNTFAVTCSDGSSCGTITNIDADFSIPTSGVTMFAYSDNNDNPTDAITEIFSALHTGDLVVGGNGGAIPANSNPTAIYPNAVVVDNFPNANPGRTEYKFPTERQVTVTRTLLTNVANWLHAQSTATALSTVRFTNIIVTSGVANPLVTVTASPSSVLENSGSGITYTFTLSQNAASNMTINFGVSGTATFTTDYTQTGATSFTASTGSVVIPSGSNSASVTITPVAETTLEPNETVVLTIDAGTGYDAGNPNVGTGTITNDDVRNVNPLVVIVGMNHGNNSNPPTSQNPDGFSFAANQNLTAGTDIYFVDGLFNNTSLLFGTVESVTKYTVPSGGLAKGQVIYIVETGATTNVFTVTCSAGSNCGTATYVTQTTGTDFSFASGGDNLYAYSDTDGDPTNGITDVHSLFYAINSSIPSIENPTTVFPNAVVVTGFGSASPDRTEYKFASSERSAPINLANIQNTANYLIAQANQNLSVIPFAALDLCPTTISVQPVDRSICANANTTFGVTSTGTTFQWQVNTGVSFTNITNGGIYSGATSATLTLTGVPSANNGFTYRCVINDCRISDAKTLTVSNPVLTAASQTNVACFGGSNGSASVNVATGGTTPYSYNWTPGNPTGDGTIAITGLTAGNWTCTATDNIGCTATRLFTVTQPSDIVATAASQTNVSCFGGTNGAASINAPTGGVGGFTYSWTPGNPTGDGTRSITGLTATTWTCTITDANSCTKTVNFTITQPSAVPAPTSPTATPSSITVSGNTTTLTATGCSSPSTITWYDSSNPTVALPNNTPAISAPKTFFAKCTNTNNCVSDASTTVSVTYNPCVALTVSPGNIGIGWTGLVSTDWNNPCNWNPAWVPDATNSQVVINLQTNQPTITSTVPTVNQIYINANAILTVSSGGTLNSNSTVAPITLQGGNIINDGTINVSGGGNSVGFNIGATASITNRGTITANTLIGASLGFGNLTFTNESTGIFNGDFKANNNILTLTNRGTINYTSGSTYALSLGSTGSTVTNDGTISITVGSGISNPSGSTINNNACGKILMSAGNYENGGTTTNAGLIQMPNLYNFTNTGTFTNNRVLKANVVLGITNNKMVITNACPIFTLGGTNNYTVSGIFTDAGATTSAGTYTSVGNKFTANNTLPTGTQTLYTSVTDGACTFTVPFDFNNAKPTAVSVNNTAICTGASVTLSGTCASGTTLTWYTTATGGSNIGTGTSLSVSPTVATTYYAACEATNCISGRVATSEVTVSTPPFASANSNSPICAGATLNLNSGSEGNTYLWTGPNSFTSTELSPSIANATVSATGTYTITITNASSCTSTATTAVTVNAAPAATASSNSPVCIGNSISLIGGGVGTYAWSGPNGYSSTAQSPTITNASVLATGTYTITVTNVNGCTATATTSVTVSVLPTITTGASPAICAGATSFTIPFTATTGTPTTYSISGTGITTVTDAVLPASPITVNLSSGAVGSSTYSYTLTVKNASGCSSSNVTGSVSVNPAIVLTCPVNINTTACQTQASVNTAFAAWLATASASGGVSGVLTNNNTGAPSACGGSTTVTFTYTNTCSPLVTTCQATFTVTAPPTVVLTCPVNTNTAACQTQGAVNTAFAAWLATASGSGGCNGVLTNNNTGAPSATGGSTTVTFTYTSTCAPLTTTCQATFTVSPPPTIVLTCPVNTNTAACQTQAAVNTAFAAWLATASAIGGCNGVLTNNNTGAPAACGGSTTVTFTYTSATAPLTTTCQTTFTVTAPPTIVLTCPVNTNTPSCQTQATVNTAFAAWLATASGSGGCNSVLTNNNTGAPSATGGTTTVTFTYTSACAPLTSTCQATFTVSPPTTVVLTCPVNTNTAACQTQASVNTAFAAWLATASASGGCNGVLTNNNTGAPAACGGSTTVTFTYTSSTVPLTTTCQATFTVSSPPTVILTCPINTSITANQTQAAVNTAFAAWLATASGSGGCTGVLTNNNTGAPSACGGATTVIFTYTTTCVPLTTTCQATFTVPNSTATITAGSNTPICTGGTLNLTSALGFSSYVWTGVNGFTANTQNPSIANVTTAATGTYLVIATNANGCTAMATTSATVNPTPATPTTQADTQIIFGGSVSLTATGCSGSGSVLKWYQTADNVLVTMPVSPTATTQYYAKCEVTANGITCISGNSNNVTVTVLQPQPPVATGATICSGSSVTLTATGCSGSTGTFVLKWYLNATDALVTMPVSPTTNTDYYAKCEQTFNSVTAISAKSNVVTVTVLNPIAPVATGGTIYLGNSITLTATGCTGAGFVIKWYQTADNVLVTMPVSPTVTTQYYAKCEQTANSVTCTSVKSNDVTVTVVNRIFVDITKIAAPIQNGNSWVTAYGNLQTGLAAAAAVVVSAPAEVWVAQGTYKPTTTTTRTIYFNIPSNVKVYGGFAGTENALNERNFRTNSTILSADIGVVNVASDNSYHVVTFDGSSNTTVLDGFTITGGYASFDPRRVINAPVFTPPTASTIETGGGIVVQNAGSPMIANCTIVNNAAVIGGGIYASDASLPKVVACKIMSNQATFGAGIYFQDGSNGSVSNSLISGNRGIGAVYNNLSNSSLTNCTIAGNGGYNGGIFNATSQPIIRNSIIWGNSTPFNDTQSIITYSTVQGGYAGLGNLSFDPKFVSPVPDGLSPTLNGDYHLQASSLAIDRGDNTGISLTDTDLDGNLRRFNGGTVDMGAYEFQGVATSNLVISAQTGDWEISSTWVGFKVPQLGDVVIIDANHIVTINTTAIAKNIEYRATGQVKFKTVASKLNIGF